jgi:hypothetical protein
LTEPLGFSGTSSDSIAFEINMSVLMFLAFAAMAHRHKAAITEQIEYFIVPSP